MLGDLLDVKVAVICSHQLFSDEIAALSSKKAVMSLQSSIHTGPTMIDTTHSLLHCHQI